MPDDMKIFDARDLATMTTGILLKEPFAGGEVADHVLGRPVWTHELGIVFDEVRRAIIAQWPEAPTEKPGGRWQVLADDLAARYPDGIPIKRGSTVRTQDPIETLREVAPNADIIVVNTGAKG